MLTIYGRATSSNVQLVMWAVAELGLEHERLEYGLAFGGNDTPEFLAMNPRGLVPVLKDGDVVVWESCAIVRYLATKYGDGGAFWPSDLGARARIDMWAEWAKLEVTRGFTVPIFWSRVRTSAKERDEAALAKGLSGFEALLDLIDSQLDQHAYVAGPEFSVADIVVGHVLYRWFTIDVPRKPRPNLESYYQNLTTRPAYRDHVMVDFSVLQVEGA